jgi:hypothetical protein
LGINKYKLLAAQVDATLMMEGIAGGEIMEVEFSNWIRLNSLKL